MVTVAERAIVAYVKPAARRSERHTCRWLGFGRSSVRYRAVRPGRDEALRRRLRELAEAHPRWGCPMLTWRLRQEGVRDNHKRIRRLYRLEGLAVRRQHRTRVARQRVERPAPGQARLALWRHHDNTARPHKGLGRLTPQQYARQLEQQEGPQPTASLRMDRKGATRKGAPLLLSTRAETHG